MDGPNVVEVDPNKTLLVMCLEECVVVDVVKKHDHLCWWNVDQTSLTKRSALTITIITFSWYKFAINNVDV